MDAPHKQGLSARLVARQVSELLLASGIRWQKLVPQEGISLVLFQIVLSASIAHRPLVDSVTGTWIGIEHAGQIGRPVSATAVAMSMGLSNTTVRRHATGLVEAGLLERRRVGFQVPLSFFAEGGLGSVAAGDANDLARVLRDLASAEYAPAVIACASIELLSPGVAERLLLAFGLRVLETFTALYGDFFSGVMLASIVAANVRHITDDPQLAGRYADEKDVPPDSERRPITLRALARSLDAPFETVRRRVKAHVSTGMVVVKNDGVIVPARMLTTGPFIENNRRIVLHFEQMLQSIVSLAARASSQISR